MVDGEVQAECVAGAASSAVLVAERRHSGNRMTVGHTVWVPRPRSHSDARLTTQQTHCSCQSKASCSASPELLSSKPSREPKARHRSKLVAEANVASEVRENQRSVAFC